MPDPTAEVFASAFRQSRPSVAIVGAGAVARAFALRLAETGYPVRAIVSQRAPSSISTSCTTRSPGRSNA